MVNSGLIRRYLKLGVGVLIALASVPVLATEPQVYPPISVSVDVQRVPGTEVYYVLGYPAVPDKGNEGHTSNAGFVVTKAGVVVFDALGTPALGDALLKAIQEITEQPVRYVVVSHYHADHIYGLQAFQDQTGATIIAQAKASWYFHGDPSGIRDSGAARARLAQRREALAPWVNARTRVVEPDITFEDRLTLALGDTRFHIVYAGPAHSPGDSMMLVEPAGVLFAGDIVQDQRIPVLDGPDVHIENWLDGLATVRQLDPRVIIPGHGKASDDAIEAIDFTSAYLKYVRDRMREAIESWDAFEDAYERIDWSRYAALPAFKETNKRNTYAVYLDMEKSLLE